MHTPGCCIRMCVRNLHFLPLQHSIHVFWLQVVSFFSLCIVVQVFCFNVSFCIGFYHLVFIKLFFIISLSQFVSAVCFIKLLQQVASAICFNNFVSAILFLYFLF